MTTTSDSTVIKDNVKKAYNSISGTYSEWTETHHEKRIKYLNLLLDHLSHGMSHQEERPNSVKSVLELGCGSGQPVTAILASTQTSNVEPTPRFQVIGNDISAQQLKLASQTLKSVGNVELREGDMMELSFGDESLDAVLGMYAIIHLPRDEQSILLKRIHTWLKPGGYFLGNFAAEELGALYDENWLGCDVDKGAMFWSSWGEEGTLRILAEIGFDVVLRDNSTDIEDGKNGEKDEVPFLWVLAKKNI
ncbi:S-adenosyl-L-methionine-dependent methyltransferase [Aspergillus unguis]